MSPPSRCWWGALVVGAVAGWSVMLDVSSSRGPNATARRRSGRRPRRPAGRTTANPPGRPSSADSHDWVAAMRTGAVTGRNRSGRSPPAPAPQRRGRRRGYRRRPDPESPAPRPPGGRTLQLGAVQHDDAGAQHQLEHHELGRQLRPPCRGTCPPAPGPRGAGRPAPRGRLTLNALTARTVASSTATQ